MSEDVVEQYRTIPVVGAYFAVDRHCLVSLE